jgi:hypothetical protein
MKMSKSDCYLGNHKTGLFLAESFHFIQMTEELTTFYELHEEINSEVILKNVIHPYNKRMINCV